MNTPFLWTSILNVTCVPIQKKAPVLNIKLPFNEPMSFSNYLTFSASLMKAVMKGKSQSPNNQPIEDQTKFRNI